MAIQKTYVVNGVTGTYWKTINVSPSPDFTQTRAKLNLYANLAAYVAGGPVIDQEEVILSGSNNPVPPNSYAELVETALVGLSGSIWFGGSVVN